VSAEAGYVVAAVALSLAFALIVTRVLGGRW
jgi:hypothetical protein